MNGNDEMNGLDENNETALTVMNQSAIAEINRSEVETQIATALKHPRSINRFMQLAESIATISVEVAASCMYTLPRGGKKIVGPSVRLAEIVASAYGNLHIGARPAAVGDTDVTAQGVCWDLERNVRCVMESKRRITNSNGTRYNEDMIIMTQNAAAAIARRNAIFQVVPRAFVDVIFEKVRKVAVGGAKTLVTRRSEIFARLEAIDVDEARALHAVERESVADVTLGDLEVLIGLGTSVKDGTPIAEAFPAPPVKDKPGAPVPASELADAPEGQRTSLKTKKTEQAPATSSATPPASSGDSPAPADKAQAPGAPTTVGPSTPPPADVPPAAARSTTNVVDGKEAARIATRLTKEQQIALATKKRADGKPAFDDGGLIDPTPPKTDPDAADRDAAAPTAAEWAALEAENAAKKK